MSNNEEPVTNNSKTCTDLPLLPGGNNGNEVRAPDVEASTDIARLLSEMLEPLPEPPFELLDSRAVREWIELATERLLFDATARSFSATQCASSKMSGGQR